MSSTAAANQPSELTPDALTKQTVPHMMSASGLELRQVAGLTAGDSMPLPPGSYDFGSGNGHSKSGHDASDRSHTERSHTVGFSLDVALDSTVIVRPGASGIHLDTQRITEAVDLAQQTINVGSARFRVGTPRPHKRRRDEIVAGSAPQIHEPVISPTDPPSIRELDRAGQLNKFSWQLRQARTNLADQRRAQHPDPEEVLYRANVGSSLSWHRRSDHWHFGQVSVATADLPWQPRLEPGSFETEHAYETIRSLSTLPSVPVLADLRVGPLAIVGSRAARLACARHIMTSLATLSSPEFVAMTVLAEGSDVDDWQWAHTLPHTRATTGSALPVMIVDGLAQLQDNNFGMALTEPGGIGVVLLADDIRALPPTCATIMRISSDGSATVLNHRDGWSTSQATPHGISLGKATTAAIHLSGLNR